MRSLVCFPFCLMLLLFCLTAETSQRSSSCCLQTSRHRISKNRVLNYTVQKAGVCPIDAIVLMTIRGKIKCFDSDSDWIKNIMRMVDQKKASPSQNAKRQKKNNRRKGHRQKNQKKN